MQATRHMRILCFAVSIVIQYSGLLLICTLGCITVVSGLLPMVTIYVSKYVLDAIIKLISSNGGNVELRRLAWCLLAQLLAAISILFFQRLKAFVNYLVGIKIAKNMNSYILSKIMTLDYAYFDMPTFYNTMKRAQSQSSVRPLNVVYKLSSIVQGIVTFISMGTVILSFDTSLFFSMFFIGIPALLVQVKFGDKKYSLEYSRTEDMRMSGYLSSIMTSRRHLPEIISYDLWAYLYGKWHTAIEKFYQQDFKLHKKQSIGVFFSELIIQMTLSAASCYIIYVAVFRQAGISVGSIMMYISAFAAGVATFRTMFSGIAGIYEDTLFLDDLETFGKFTSQIENNNHGIPMPKIVKNIEFRNVSFKYPGSNVYVLKNISIIFNECKTVLILGLNGAGKTTLIRLLMRLYDPTEGQILINGIDVKSFSIKSLRQSIGIIFQDYIPYAFSVKENIACGDINNIENTERVISASKKAHTDEFVRKLPKQYDTILSKQFEDGQELSLGQWQRICLARLFMKDSPVCIFDEPTASLDIETEAHLLHEIRLLSKSKINILISHRMFREGIADKIVIIENGRIIEQGTYADLMSRNGAYKKLSRLYYDEGGFDETEKRIQVI